MVLATLGVKTSARLAVWGVREWEKPVTENTGEEIQHDSETFFCDQCRETEDRNEAEYLLASEEETLQGPALGDPDYWPATASRPQALCREHYLQLSADERLDYTHRGDDFELML